jgi:hypothetical protein
MRMVFWSCLSIGAALASGCGDPAPLPMAGTPESSREVLVAGLAGWKAGKSLEELNSGSSAVQFVDDDMNGGVKLIDYKIEGEPKAHGTGYRYVVTLKTQGKDGKTRDKKVAYIAVSKPKPAVSREDRKP